VEQSARKMFKNCPYQKHNFENCQMCPNYAHCIEKQKSRIQQRKKQKRKQLMRKIHFACILTLCILLIITMIIALYMCFGENVFSNKTKAELSPYGPSEEYFYNISYEEKVMIAKVVWAECGFECFECKVAVASVVLNRYFYGNHCFDRKSISTVITQPYQFASIKNVTKETLDKHPECMEAVEAACKGWDPTRKAFPQGALYFYAPALMNKDFQKGVEVLSIGNVNFHYDYEN